jgi:prevent-host-death family protein
MCYMKANNTVGVRELRQNLSIYLRRVAAGQTLRVTERGRIVAALVPLHDEEPILNRLAKERRLILPQGDLLALGLPKGSPTTKASKALTELREERL